MLISKCVHGGRRLRACLDGCGRWRSGPRRRSWRWCLPPSSLSQQQVSPRPRAKAAAVLSARHLFSLAPPRPFPSVICSAPTASRADQTCLHALLAHHDRNVWLRCCGLPPLLPGACQGACLHDPDFRHHLCTSFIQYCSCSSYM